MDEERRLRYRDKTSWIQNRIELIESWLGEVPDQEMKPDTKTTLAVFKAFQEIVEAMMDINAMHLRDQDYPARDDYSNIEKTDTFSQVQKDLLRGMNGLRNRIIHRYNATDEKLALTGIAESLVDIPGLILVFEEWIRKT